MRQRQGCYLQEHALVVPDGNHGATIADRKLPTESRDLAYRVLEAWTGVKPLPLDPAAIERQERQQDLYFHLPPQRFRL